MQKTNNQPSRIEVKRGTTSPVQIEDSSSDDPNEDVPVKRKRLPAYPLLATTNKPSEDSNVNSPTPSPTDKPVVVGVSSPSSQNRATATVTAAPVVPTERPIAVGGQPNQSVTMPQKPARQAAKAPVSPRISKVFSPQIYGPTRLSQQPRLFSQVPGIYVAPTPNNSRAAGPYYSSPRMPMVTTTTPNAAQWAALNRYGLVTGHPVDSARIHADRSDGLRVEHIGKAPARGAPGLWVLLKDDT